MEHRYDERPRDFIKVLLMSSTPISSLIRATKLFIKRHIWLKLKAIDAFCSKVKDAAIGYKILIFQTEDYSGVNRRVRDRFTA